MKDLYVFPYKAVSKSAIAISDALDCWRINRSNSRFTYGSNKAVINWGWGDSLPTEVSRCLVYNKPEAVARAVNKVESFKTFVEHRVNCPMFTQDKTTAKQWLNSGYKVYCRLRASGSDGSGLQVVQVNRALGVYPDLPDSRLYTRGLATSAEYRVNVVGDEVITYQKKVPVSSRTDHDYNIRTTAGGWGFEVVEDERNIPSNIDEECILAVKALGLDFGGVDVAAVGNKAYVLEVNTAPHLTPYSARKMAQALREYIG